MAAGGGIITTVTGLTIEDAENGGSAPKGPGGSSFGGFPLIDPKQLYQSCMDRRLPVSDWYRKANSFRCPLNEVGRGWILMKKEHLDQLQNDQSYHLIFRQGGGSVDLQKITIVSARCVAPGYESDPDNPFLVEVVDRRHYMNQPTRLATTDGLGGRNAWSFNLRSNWDGNYIPFSIKSTGPDVAYSWQEVVDLLWAAASNYNGPSSPDYPPLGDLPFTPDGEPEGFELFDMKAYDALVHVLSRIQCAIRYNPVSDEFDIVRLGDDDNATDQALLGLEYAPRAWDGYFREVPHAENPRYISVYFPRLPKPSGRMFPYYVKSEGPFGTELSRLNESTTLVLFDELYAIGLIDPSEEANAPDNATEINARATERANDWIRAKTYFYRPILKKIAGVNPLVVLALGSKVGAWAIYDFGGGWFSEAYSGPDLEKRLMRPAETDSKPEDGVGIVRVCDSVFGGPYTSTAPSTATLLGTVGVTVPARSWGDQVNHIIHALATTEVTVTGDATVFGFHIWGSITTGTPSAVYDFKICSGQYHTVDVGGVPTKIYTGDAVGLSGGWKGSGAAHDFFYVSTASVDAKVSYYLTWWTQGGTVGGTTISVSSGVDTGISREYVVNAGGVEPGYSNDVPINTSCY